MTIEDIIVQVKPLAANYYRLTGKPLGVTGEIGEQEVARLLDLQLAPARTAGYDATDRQGRKYQIKARAPHTKGQNTGKLAGEDWDAALLAIYDENLKELEIWEAERTAVVDVLDKPGSKGRNERRMMSLTQFKKIGHKRYPAT